MEIGSILFWVLMIAWHPPLPLFIVLFVAWVIWLGFAGMPARVRATPTAEERTMRSLNWLGWAGIGALVVVIGLLEGKVP